jgi:hypothetical protein
MGARYFLFLKYRRFESLRIVRDHVLRFTQMKPQNYFSIRTVRMPTLLRDVGTVPDRCPDYPSDEEFEWDSKLLREAFEICYC